MKKLVLLIALIYQINLSYSQTVIWTESFSNGCASDCFANAYVGPNGAWTVTNTGANGADANVWYVSGAECGNNPGACGSVCGATDPSLHISSGPTLLGDQGAAYAAGGLGFFFVETDKRVESPTINLTGQSTITLNFNYIEDYVGQAGYDASDDATVWYFDGVVWAQINPLAITPNGGCAPQGNWTAFSVALPASANNNPNVKIGFRWVNDDDNNGTDPSIAIDDITLTIPTVGGPTASFTTPTTTICAGTCIDFTNTSTGGPFTVTDWTFTGATPGTSAANNPTGICYNTAGTYAVSLTVTDAGALSNTSTVAGYITVVAAPDAGLDGAGNVCDNATLNLNTLVSGSAGGTWAETSGTPSGQFTAGTGVLDGNGLTVGNIYTFTYTVNATAPCVGSDVATFTITVVSCSGGLTASFTPSQLTICQGACITFTENSFGGTPTGWNWLFNGGTPPTSVSQNPGSICFNSAGVQAVTLTITDGVAFDDTTINITVNPAPVVTGTSSLPSPICAGDAITLTGGGAVTYAWDNGVTNGVSFVPLASTNYTVTGTDANGCTASAIVMVTLNNCDPMIAGFSYQDNICVNDCITLTDTTTGNPVSWAWDFGGGASPNTSTDQNPVVCFNSSGTYNIQLTTTDAFGANSSTTNSISVFDVPNVTATLDSIIEIGGMAELLANGSGPGSYLWTPASGDIDCDTCSSTFARPEVSTTFTITFSDINGCKAQDTVMILVNFIEGIGVPQAFSPNGDGKNDILFVKGYGIVSMNFAVYNQYGQQVFETSDQNIGWDGKFHNKDENPGVFVWVLEYTLINGNGGNLKGNTTLIR